MKKKSVMLTMLLCAKKKVENISPRAASALGFSCL